MEKTVTISLEEYDHLKKIESKCYKGDVIIITQGMYNPPNYEFVTESKAMQKIIDMKTEQFIHAELAYKNKIFRLKSLIPWWRKGRI